MFGTFRKIITEKEHGFTLIELIIVIIIVGILAALGIGQYSKTVEKSRVAEAKTHIGNMRKLAYEYYLNNGTYTGLTDAYLGVDNTCRSTDYYKYFLGSPTDAAVYLYADRCASGGKSPQGPAYRLVWGLDPSGLLWQYAYQNSTGGAIFSSDWGDCCR